MKHVLFEAIGQVDDGYLTRAEKALEAPSHRGTGRKLWTVALAAAICASVLAATAMATGWETGIFRELENRETEDQALFQAAADVNQEVAPEFASIPELDLSQFVLLEKYFDGNTILLGYDMEAVLPRPAVGVEVEEEMLQALCHAAPMASMPWSGGRTQVESPATAKAKEYNLAQNGFYMDEDLQTILTTEEYERMWEILESQGYVVIAAWDAYVSDGISVNGMDLWEAYDKDHNAYASRTEYETEYGTCLRLEPLPEDVKDGETVTVTLGLKSGLWYYYLDLEGNAYMYCHHTQRQDTPFTIERSGEK